ncbi:MAG TPA: exonuclease domain-containing protein, partial [Candidatus Dormibacteraeota bacterium]|nr:exonuclease domain-containing protein [Candidatus Dormibacteraeota bacterium]
MSEPVYAAFDLETTGLSWKADRIIEIGAVRFTLSDGVQDTFETLVDPGLPIPLAIQRLCGISDRDVAGGPAPEEAVAQLAEFVDGATLVAHSGAFDLSFCAAQLPAVFAHRPCLDTLELARILLPGAPSHSLPDLALRLGLMHEAPHRALSDAVATRLLLLHLLEQVEQLPGPLRGRMRELCQGAGDWPVAGLLAQGPAPERAIPPAASPPRPADRTRERPRAGSPAEFLPLEVAALLGPEGPLAAASPDFELRETQQQMAIAVGQALRRNHHLLVEAGTGIGKSYAYLVPAREWAATTGERVVVSTHTIPLQEQLVEQDLPALEALRPLGLRVALLKGRGHYLSLRRLERWLRLPSTDARGRVDLDVLRFKLRCLVWAAKTERGDRAELRLAGPDAQLWDRVASTTDDCLGPACHNWRSGACFMVQARLAAQEADLLVVNHALLLADGDSGGSVLPAFTRLVVDEAHHL